MRPSVAETIGCVLENLEALVFPDLTEEHARSVARCTSILLRVAMLRLEQEPAILAADSAEKRMLLTMLAADLPVDLEAIPQAHHAGQTSPDALENESEALKAVLHRAIQQLHASRSELGEARFGRLQQAVRIQLRAQIDREHMLVASPYSGPGFPY